MCENIQMAFWPAPSRSELIQETPDLPSYDRFLVFFSGGKDSVACVLHLIEMGVDPRKIELHHHLVDGREGSTLMDWPVTSAYCKAFAEALGLKQYFSWKSGGFEQEMLRDKARTAPIVFEREDGSLCHSGGDLGTEGTRRKFPQVAASLMTRWCSAYLKIDVGARVITREDRFRTGKTLVVTGERAQESAARAAYQGFERHRSDNRDGKRVTRHVDHWRPVHAWKEEEVWAIMRRHRINPHPAYHLGWGRTSCRTCIFGSANQWATIRKYMPDAFEAIANYEEMFGTTIQRKLSVRQLADKGVPYDCDPLWLRVACADVFSENIIIEGEWALPPGAFGEGAGPV